MKKFKRIICIVLDGVGVGEAPDAADYGDAGSNSLANTARHVGALRLPMLQRMGLGNIVPIGGVAPVESPIACYGRMTPAAAGKDSTTGHWELMGCVLETPFPTYPDGFPVDVIDAFERATGRGVIGNRPASGTAIIQELGDRHVQTGSLIVYTSQDSVFQIAAHEDVVPLEMLYGYCQRAREILREPHDVARVIARPFAGRSGGYYRTGGRRDYAVAPPRDTVLDALASAGFEVLTIGKIHDLFCGRGIASSLSTKDNREGIERTVEAIRRGSEPFVFTNLVDFDTMWGHRNDARAYALGLEEFDSYLAAITEALDEATLLVITSDHGNDPTTPSTDHSRENVPLIVYHPTLSSGVDLGTRDTLADVAGTIADNFELRGEFAGRSFLREVR